MRGAGKNANTRACDRGSGPTRSSVNRRIAIALPCHLHDSPAKDHPAWESISARGQPAVAALRVDVLSLPGAVRFEARTVPAIAILFCSEGPDLEFAPYPLWLRVDVLSRPIGVHTENE